MSQEATDESRAEQSASTGLSTLRPNKGSRRRRKRLGKGEGSGNGKTCGKGQKGQKSRSGAAIPAGFEGGQMPIHRRLPKRGFTSRKRVRGENVYSLVSLDVLEALPVTEVTLDILRENGLVRTKSGLVKILGDGTLTKKLTVEAHAASKSAQEAISRVGGELRLVS